MKVAVLMGGKSFEREVSLASGKVVCEALEEAATMAAGGMSVEDALAACVETSNAAMQG